MPQTGRQVLRGPLRWAFQSISCGLVGRLLFRRSERTQPDAAVSGHRFDRQDVVVLQGY